MNASATLSTEIDTLCTLHGWVHDTVRQDGTEIHALTRPTLRGGGFCAQVFAADLTGRGIWVYQGKVVDRLGRALPDEYGIRDHPVDALTAGADAMWARALHADLDAERTALRAGHIDAARALYHRGWLDRRHPRSGPVAMEAFSVQLRHPGRVVTVTQFREITGQRAATDPVLHGLHAAREYLHIELGITIGD